MGGGADDIKVSPKQFEIRATDLLDSSGHHEDQRERDEDPSDPRDLRDTRRHARVAYEYSRRTTDNARGN